MHGRVEPDLLADIAPALCVLGQEHVDVHRLPRQQRLWLRIRRGLQGSDGLRGHGCRGGSGRSSGNSGNSGNSGQDHARRRARAGRNGTQTAPGCLADPGCGIQLAHRGEHPLRLFARREITHVQPEALASVFEPATHEERERLELGRLGAREGHRRRRSTKIDDDVGDLARRPPRRRRWRSADRSPLWWLRHVEYPGNSP